MPSTRSRSICAAAATAVLAAAALATMPVTPASAADTVFIGAGDMHSDCVNTGDLASAALISDVPGIVFTVGDHTVNGTPEEFTNCYALSWGAFKDRTMPASGDHDWLYPGAAAYFAYFGAVAGDPATGFYSYDVDDAWHVVVLNSECKTVGGCGPGSPQDLWLRADLEASAGRNVIAIWHKAPFTSAQAGYYKTIRPLFATLHRYGVELLLNGGRHLYERFAPQTADGTADPLHGVTEIIIGTAGSFSDPFKSTPAANSVVRKTNVFGVLKFTLHTDSYDWKFIPVAGQKFSDSGTASVNGGPTKPFAYDQDLLVEVNTSKSVTLHAIDMQNDPLTYVVVTPPTYGTLSGTEPDLTYTPFSGYLGDDMFVFQANDGAEDSNPVFVRLTVAAEQGVTVKDSSFSPGSATPAQGATVRWSFAGSSTHAIQDSKGLGLFNSGPKTPGTTFSYAFGAAGTYAYACTIHSTQTGSIKIPLKVAATAARDVPLTVTWASAPLAGYVYDVQVRPPGTTDWTNWRIDSTDFRGDYTPTTNGTYEFRARLQRTSSGKVSGWSPIAAVSVS